MNKDPHIKTVQVNLGERSYPIYIGRGILRDRQCLAPHIKAQQVVIVTNETVAGHYLESITSSLDAFDVAVHLMPDGEVHKHIETVAGIFDAMLQRPFDRDVTVLALGGGVVGDVAGFAAACYQRGVPFIQIPTTLLSQVDSSVGGKTGVNHPLGKNMIGAFYQPQAVVIDTDTLNTLPARELSAGLAEVVKYGLLWDANFFCWLEENAEALIANDTEALIHVIRRSCEIKAEVVSQDERESGVRALLNLGHTFGHAIENELGYGMWLHGEAVAAGMVMAADLSVREGWIDDDVLKRTKTLLQRFNLPIAPPKIAQDKFLASMKRDKKTRGHHINLVLLEQLGKAFLTDSYNQKKLNAVLNT